jgi:hypothetical protein
MGGRKPWPGLPAVILGDLKTRYTEQYPFSVLYDELHRELSSESLVVVGGYSFGDRPLNLLTITEFPTWGRAAIR